MEKKYADIINEAKKNGKTIEEINKLLKEAGATEGWTEAEMAEGFIPAEEKPKDAQRTVDMRRREDLAGTKQIQWIPGGKFEVEYDELGYAKSAVRVNG